MLLCNKHTFALLLCTFGHLVYTTDIAQEFFTLAKTCKDEKKIDKAISYYRQALSINPQYIEAALDGGNMLYNEGDFEQAIAFYKKALDANQNIPEVHYNLGMSYMRLKRIKDAIETFKKVIELNPKHTRAYIQIATIYSDRKDHETALNVLKNGLTANPDNAELLHHLGRAVRAMERYEESADLMRKALELNPRSATIMMDLANTLHMLDDFEHAFEYYKKALELKPDSVEALYNLGFTLKKCGNMQQARTFFEHAIDIHTKALELRPNYPAARFSRALSYLTLGNFAQGWPEYEARWAAYNESPKKFSQPIWEGQSLKDKRILIYAEQGYGDTFQFIRYGKVLKTMGAHVIAQTQHRLEHIIGLCPYLDEVVSDRQPLPEFDYHIALMSIPMVLKTTVETVPNEIPYLAAKTELTQQWQEKLSADKNFKVGICWQGNKQYRSVFLKKEVATKAMQLETFKPLSSVPNLSLYSLQKINGTEQLDTIAGDMKVVTFDHFDEEAGPFMDTAAIIKNLNIVITVDTSIAHLAAGLGAEVWVLLPFPADWRWMLDRNDTPWYPNMKLFRQKERGDWTSVINEVREELSKRTQETNQSIQNKSFNQEDKKKDTHRPDNQRATHVREYIHAQKNAALQKAHMNPSNTNSLFEQHRFKEKSTGVNIDAIPEEYRAYVAQSEELQYLTHQLLTMNRKLWQLEKELKSVESMSVFDEATMRLIEEIHKAHTVKTVLSQQINEITKDMKK